ncbi:MAG: hypothetical protein IT377_29860 [Polyangiaceae bacterium]|nr:hypothetical protein [Polyangiaceae bacterium]
MLDRPDLLEVLDTAYRVEGTEEAWLGDLCGAIERATQSPLGCSCFFLDASDLSRPKVRPAVHSPRAPAIDIVSMFGTLSGNGAKALFGQRPVTTSSEAAGRAVWSHVIERCGDLWPRGVQDTLGILAFDARRRGCVICIPLPRMRAPNRLELRRLSYLGVHVATALRLRRAVGARGLRADTGDGTEAVLEPSGRVVAAEGDASAANARAELREMALRLDHSRSRLRREDGDLALEAWTALVSGRWTLVDHFDTDGRRFLLAHKNPPALAEPLALDPRERMVASAIALGHPQKLVGYALGLPRPTVARLLRSALDKLGLESPAELAGVLSVFVPEEEER